MPQDRRQSSKRETLWEITENNRCHQPFLLNHVSAVAKGSLLQNWTCHNCAISRRKEKKKKHEGGGGVCEWVERLTVAAATSGLKIIWSQSFSAPKDLHLRAKCDLVPASNKETTQQELQCSQPETWNPLRTAGLQRGCGKFHIIVERYKDGRWWRRECFQWTRRRRTGRGRSGEVGREGDAELHVTEGWMLGSQATAKEIKFKMILK